MKTISVKFNNYNTAQSYDYVVEDDTKVEVGDSVLTHNGENFGVAKVYKVAYGEISDKSSKTVVAVITHEDFVAYSKRNEELGKNIRAQRAAMKQLEALLEAETKLDRYRKLAATNTEAAELLKQAGIQL